MELAPKTSESGVEPFPVISTRSRNSPTHVEILRRLAFERKARIAHGDVAGTGVVEITAFAAVDLLNGGKTAQETAKGISAATRVRLIATYVAVL